MAKGGKYAVMQHLLEWDYVPEYELLGISSSMGSHRLAWAFNRAFGWHMACADDVLAAPSKSKEPSSHPTLRWIDEASGTSVTLVLNRTSDGTLANGAGALDYLLVVHHLETPPHELMAELRRLREVSFVTALDPEAIGALEPLMALD